MLASPLKKQESYNWCIQEGDLVIVYEKHDRMKAVTVSKGAELQNRFGVFRHADWIGKPFGSKVMGKTGGHVYLLAPTPELWTLVLSHRTQILYLADISFVITFLEVRPGSVVLESGTGSGSLTTSLARAVSPTGHVYTFDFHEERASTARLEFERNGLTGIVTVGVRDIQGLGFPNELAGKADAVFLDLPQPWLAIPWTMKVLRCNGALCSFSPCIEQVQRTCEALSNQNFTDIRTFEVLVRTYDVREESLFLMAQDNDEDQAKTPFNVLPQKRSRTDAVLEQSSEQIAGTDDALCETERRACNVKSPKERQTKSKSSLILARPVRESRGHTGYLSFAYLAT